MKKSIFSLLFICLTMVVLAQDLKPIQLPKPKTEGGKSLFTALSERQSSRAFDSVRNFDNQTISNMLWCAFGYNRPDKSKRTAPSSNNCQEIDIYLVNNTGIYIWDAKKNILNPIVAGDFRAQTGQQDYVKNAAVNLVFVADSSKMKGSAEERMGTAGTDAGFISQNVYLFCASEGFATVVRGWLDRDKMVGVLKLNKNQFITIAQSVGYPLK